MDWVLPVEAEFSGRAYSLNTDYRDILDIFDYLQNDEDMQTKVYVCLALFYEDFEEMPPGDYAKAWEYLCGFINGFAPEEDAYRPQTIDWRQDYTMISAEVNKAAGCEVRSLPYLHWFTFMGYFNTIGEGQLSMVVGIREKRRKGKKLEKWEQEFYRANRARVDLKRKLSDPDQAEVDEFMAAFGLGPDGQKEG